jgi:anti-sigma B factor antagonist
MHLTTEVHDGVGVVRVQGDVDASNADQLRDASLRVLGDGASSLVVECSGLKFIDSAGLSALIAAYRAADVQWGTVTIRNPPDTARRILELTGLDKVLVIEP